MKMDPFYPVDGMVPLDDEKANKVDLRVHVVTSTAFTPVHVAI